MDQKKAIIIGSGVAGIATAIRLAVQGFDVSVFEKNNCPGGKIGIREKDGYRFDTGPSLFTQPQHIAALFTLAAEPIENYFSWQQLDISCRYFYENGKIVNAHSDRVLFAEELKEQLNESPVALTKYLSGSAQLYNNIGTIFTEHSLHKRKTWMNKRIFPALSSAKFGYLFKTLNAHNRSKFRTPEAAQLFNRYATYNGSSPYKAPGMLSLIPHLELNQGTFYPKSGMVSIIDALYRLAKKKGVQFYFNTAVQHIIYHEGIVKGIVVRDVNIDADLVVSNADIFFTYRNLMKDPYTAKKILKQERSSSALIFYWGMGRKFKELLLHNIFFSKDYKEEFDQLFNRKTLSDDPTIYINITSKMEAGHAPEGKENWFVMLNAPANTGQDWERLKREAKKNIIEKLNRMLHTDIESFIETEEILDPVMIEDRTGSYMGSLYGTSSNSKLAAFLRHPNFKATVKGLYFCGGSVHPGGGIPLCLSSAKIVSDLVEHDTKKITH
ncbi:MAG: 1-hydroxycarotenoid 3,4-desaturase CrtD [Ferruginibacter sp.]